MSIHKSEDLIDCKQNPHTQVMLRKFRPCRRSDRTGDRREGPEGTRPSQEEVEPIRGRSSGEFQPVDWPGETLGATCAGCSLLE